MLRPLCIHKGQQSIAVYMPMARDHFRLSPECESQLKEAVKAIGGGVNLSGLFLSMTSTSSVVSKSNGVVRRSVIFIPRGKLDSDLLKMLDKGKNTCTLLE